MTMVTDEYMQQMLTKTKAYTMVVLKTQVDLNTPELKKIIWEHGRRNFQFRLEGIMPIVCPVPGGGEISGFGIFTTSIEKTKKIMDEDPAVKHGIFSYDVYACRSFPGDTLPA